MKLLDNYLNKRIKALGYEPKVTRFHSSFIHPDYDELMGYASAGYRPDGSRVSPQSSIDDLTAGFGFAGAPLPNTEPVVAPAAATGSTSETNLYTPATTTNAEWALMPQGFYPRTSGMVCLHHWNILNLRRRSDLHMDNSCWYFSDTFIERLARCFWCPQPERRFYNRHGPLLLHRHHDNSYPRYFWYNLQ